MLQPPARFHLHFWHSKSVTHYQNRLLIMPAYLETLNQILALGAILMQIVIVIILITLVFFHSRSNPILVFFKEYTFYFGFLVALGAVSLSLFYSNIIGFPACELCYVERIFLYPQLVLYGMELYKKDNSIVDFSLAFAILGALTSIYHVYIENGGESSLPCAATASANTISCATRYVYEFGYVTIPVMALTLSLFLITILLNYKYMKRVK
jgi:disulfide bond formation protein DsbB